jgi:hypothetical protein
MAILQIFGVSATIVNEINARLPIQVKRVFLCMSAAKKKCLKVLG